MKRKLVLFCGVAVLLAAVFACENKQAPEGIQTVASFKSLFADPPIEYRSAPFWDWNGQITREGIEFQMKEFKKAGIGGLFVHPRPGLVTEYLSEEWFDLFNFAVEKGKEIGLNIWIYDENSYPSGFAGGHVPAQMPDSYQNGTGLGFDIQQQLNVRKSDTLIVVLKKNENGFVDVTESIDEENGQTGTYYVFRKTYPDKSPWYGGFSYVDLMYPGVTEKFIEVTMTGYEKKQEEFGKTIQGIFTDEPNLQAALGAGSVIRWTPDLWEAFDKRWGYDLKVNLPSLVEETGNWKKVRHDYYVLLLDLFVDRWAKPCSKYCDEKGLKWTGHYWEHGWPEPTEGIDEAAFYMWFQQPGIDMLGNQLDPGGMGGQFGNDRAVRELLSAANQAGRTRTLSETYGGGGWDMTFETQKRLVDWQCVLGVNFVNQHLSYYSMTGVRKYDYPPSFSYHEPWWDNYKLMADYIGRICMALSSGEQINHTLVLQPNTSAWMYFSNKDKNPAIYGIRDGFKRFVYQMEQNHLEYDLGSEKVLKELGGVKGNKLRVGYRDYSLVVIPAEMENIDRKTYELLCIFLGNGGKVLSFRKQIPMLDGDVSPLVDELMSKSKGNWVVAESLEDPQAIELLGNDDFAMDDQTQNGMLYHQRRIMDDGQILFMVNSHTDEQASSTISMKGKYVSMLDPIGGKIYSYPAKTKGDKVTFDVNLDPIGSALFIISNTDAKEPVFAAIPEAGTVMKASGATTVKRESDNVMMIGYLDLKTGKADRKDIYYMNAMSSSFTDNGVMLGNPWQHKIQYKKEYLALDTLLKDDSGFEASYRFLVNSALSASAMKEISAVVEQADRWEVSINGQGIVKTPGEYWVDKDFSVYDIGSFVQAGENTLTLKAPRMSILTEIMPVYLLGDFLVKPLERGFEITNGEIATLGSWREAGLPFYSQKVAYTQMFEFSKNEETNYFVKLNQWSGSVAEVFVNGKTAGLIAFCPYELNVTDLLQEGTNEITVKVTGSLKNTFGHFFQAHKSWIYGPFSWCSAPELPATASEYNLIDYGLFESFDLIEYPAK